MDKERKIKEHNLKAQERALAREREAHHNDVLKLAKQDLKKPKVAPKGAFISLKNINKIYPNHVQAVYDFNLDIKPNEFIVFVGPSGCGKSTTLRMVAGLEDITYGDLYMDGKYANNLLPKDRQIGMVFQSYALYPHMTVYENMAFALVVKHIKKDEIDRRVKEAARILQIEEYLSRKPNALSGGQCQRVALGRAICADSKLLLMDEPLSNLDAKLRVTMRSEIVKLHEAMGKTTIYVTHDQTEAMTMATRIVVMSKGYVQQIGTPEEIFNKPANLFVATFVGSPSMNLLDAKNVKDSLVLEDGHILAMEKGFNNKINEFYANEIEFTKKEIEGWKDTLLDREHGSKAYSHMISNGQLRKDKFKSYVNKLDDLVLVRLKDNKESILNRILKLEHSEEMIKQFDVILRNYLYEMNKTTNPGIVKVLEKLGQLIACSKEEEKKLTLGIRPEHIIKEETKTKESFELNVSLSELLGSEYFVHFNYSGIDLVAKMPVSNKISNGDKVIFSFDKNRIHIFDPVTKKRVL